MDKKNLILIDGHALAFRSFHALERTRMKTSSNQPTWAIYGFFKAIFDLLKNKNIKSDALIVAFDVGRKTFRVEKFEQYKANRGQMPDELKSQLSLIIEGLNTFNIPIYTKEGYEADDVIGTIVEKTKQENYNTLILTGDRDAFQLIDKNGEVKVLIPQTGSIEEYDWEKVYLKMGVYPDQIVDYKALSGDVSDNIPGVKGIGPKTASELLNKYKTLNNIYDNIDNISKKSVKEKLISGMEEAKLSQFLATIDRNVDLDFNIKNSCLKANQPDKIVEYFKKLQLYGFIKNINEIFSYFNICDSNTDQYKENDNLTGQLSLNFDVNIDNKNQKTYVLKNSISFKKEIIDNNDKFNDFINSIEKKTLISFNIEPENIENPFDSKIIGISFAFCDNIIFKNNEIVFNNSFDKISSYYLPFFNIGQNLNFDYVFEKLKNLFENQNIKKTVFDAKFNINLLKKQGINVNGIVFDPMLASYVYDSNRRHALNIQSQENIDYIIKSEEELLGKGKNALKFNQISVNTASDYSNNNSYATLKLTQYWMNKLDLEDKNLLYKIELPVMFVLAKMEQIGVSIDEDYLISLNKTICKQISKLEDEIFNIAGENFNVNSPKKVGEILFDKLGLKLKSKTKGATKYSTNAKVLEELALNYPIASKIIEHRHLMKLKTTYIDTLPKLLDKSDNRIHTTYNQTIATTGRLTSTNPNLQNIPIRTEIGMKIREAFVPKDKNNQLILSADYSQIELRLLAHVCEDENLIFAFNTGVDIHTLTASKIYSVNPKDVTKDMRRMAKAVNFGIVYGQTKYGLSQTLGITVENAEIFIDKYFQTYPKAKEYMDECIAFATLNGFCKTIYGRKRYLENELNSSNRQIQEFATRAAINSPLQGSASDLIKLAMIDLNKELEENKLKSNIIMQVHDELVLEIYKEEKDIVTKLVKESMELNQPLKVPLVVDITINNNWVS